MATNIPVLAAISRWSKISAPRLHVAVLLAATFVMIVLAHTLQIWLWALTFLLLEAQPDLTTAVYFSLVTYTTLGYGDVTLSPEFAVFGAFASVTGLLTFGVSTAFVVGVVARVLPKLSD